jgi:hypothetical protein
MPILYVKYMRFRIKYLSLAFVAVVFLTACKKYPDNTLWFKNPVRVIGRGALDPWKLVLYKVDDRDSTSAEYLKIWRIEGLVIEPENFDNTTHPYNCLDIIDGFWHFSKNKKRIYFRFGITNYSNSPSNPNYVNQRNIFMVNGLEWKIDKLTPDELRIITETGGTKYEIHFK